jgi:predicted ABC-type ATPase
VAKRPRESSITVLAGTNGAGKSSVAGARLARASGDYFNPDTAAKRIRDDNPVISQDEANAAAWQESKRLLESAIAHRKDFVFETTLGGNTIAALLEKALAAGIEVHIFYVGLRSPELHIARVRARVLRGGHDIPENKIRERYDRSRLNLIRLLPHLTELLVYDNSHEADPHTGAMPKPLLVLHLKRGRVLKRCDLAHVPDWAKPILMAVPRKSE